LPFVRPDEPTKEVAALEQIEGVCVTVNGMVGQLEDSFQIGAGLSASAFRLPGDRLRTVRGELAHLFKIERRPISVGQMLLQLLKECERLSDLSRNLAVRSSENPRQIRTARLRFYLGGLAASAAEHVHTLTKQWGSIWLLKHGRLQTRTFRSIGKSDARWRIQENAPFIG
jgi:hypothetical protein